MIWAYLPITEMEFNKLQEKPKQSFWQKLTKKKVEFSFVDQFIDFTEKKEKETLDVDKSWDLMLYFLTWESLSTIYENEKKLKESLSISILWKEEFWEDIGYGSPTITKIEYLNSIYSSILWITKNSFYEKFDAKAMSEKEIYSFYEVKDDEKEETVEYAWNYFEQLRNLYKETIDSWKHLIHRLF